MAANTLRPADRSHRARSPRRRSAATEHSDRRALEHEGWRTLLDYRENHVRADDGLLIEVVPCWIAEAERTGERVTVATATAPTAEVAWARLRSAIIDAARRPYDRQRDSGGDI